MLIVDISQRCLKFEEGNEKGEKVVQFFDKNPLKSLDLMSHFY